MKSTVHFLSSLLFCLPLMAQQKVNGTISSTLGEPLIGVNIIETGTTIGAVSDLSGNFEIQLSKPDATLEFSYTGYETVVVEVGDRKTIDLTMKETTNLLGQVVVSTLGMAEKKDRRGATSSTILSQDVTRSGEASFLQGLGAKASNVQIDRVNGDAGSGVNIRIRGANSISGSSNPLFILDGIPVSNQTIYGGASQSRDEGVAQQSRLNDLNPNDVESIHILKGASAAALWGSRAANGVVVITTKKGQFDRLNIDYSFALSFDKVLEKYPLQSSWGQGRGGNYSPTRAESWGDYIPDRSGGPDEVDQSGERFLAEDGTAYYPILTKNSKDIFLDKNWDSAIQQGGFAQHNLSISGGTKKTQLFFGLGRMEQEGILPNNFYDRTNLRLNSSSALSEWLNISTKSSFVQSKSNRLEQGQSTAGIMLGLLRTPPDFDNEDYIGTYVDDDGKVIPFRHRSYRNPLGSDIDPDYNNPLWTANEQKANTVVNRYTFSSDLDISPTNWLLVKLRGGIDGYTDNRTYFFPIGSSKRTAGEYDNESLTNLESNFDAIAKGSFPLSNAMGLTATVGWNFNNRSFQRGNATLQGFNVNVRKETAALNSSAAATQFVDFRSEARTNRGYAILNFDWNDRLFLNLTGALEAASTVRDKFFYPSADLAYQLINAANPTRFVDFVKIRASYGKVGIQPPAYSWETLTEGNFSYGSTGDPLDIALFGGGFRLANTKGNPDLEPEIKTEWELGSDFRLLKNRLAFSLTYYQNKIEGIIIPVALAPSFGFGSEISNAASMENKGLELDFDYLAFSEKDIEFGLFGNWSNNRNKVLDIQNAESIDMTPGAYISSRVIKGQPLGILFGTSSQMDEQGNLVLNQFGFPQLAERPQVLGDPNPDWRGGLGFRFKWKNLFANALIEHSQGGVFSPRTLWVLRRFGVLEETANRITLTEDLINYDGKVIPAGTTVRGNVEDFGGGNVLLDEAWYRTSIGGGSGENQAYNFALYDATFTRFKELTIGYVFNSKALKDRTKLSSITIGFTGRNLFLIDNIPGIDPETHQFGVANSRGLDYFNNPTTKSFLFNLKLSY